MKKKEVALNLLVLPLIAFLVIGWNLKSIIPKDKQDKIANEITPALPPEVIDAVGALAFKLKIATCKLSKNKEDIKIIDKVGKKIINAAKQSEYADSAQKYDWEIKLIDDDRKIDAFAMPGGKIGVYSGVFRVTKRDEAQLSAIIGHEMIHALERHAGERMDAELRRGLALAATGLMLDKGGLKTEQIIPVMVAMGVEYQNSVIMPFSKEHESEADHIGLLLMGQAGYDPRAALKFWRTVDRMEKKNSSKESNVRAGHPVYDSRIANLRGWMPQALSYYR
jgi:predicted Zn-dependent protease